MPPELRNYILMKEVFHCGPQEIDELPDSELDIYYWIHCEFIAYQNKKQQSLKNKKKK